MFLVRLAARTVSPVAHVFVIGIVTAVPKSVVLPFIEPPCSQILTWVRPAGPPSPVPPPQVEHRFERVKTRLPAELFEWGDALRTDDFGLDDRRAGGAQPQGVCGCVEGGVVDGVSSGVIAGRLLPLEPAPLAAPLVARSLRAGEDIPTPPKIVDVSPRYPRLARQGRLEGIVILDATIDEFGRVVDLKVLRSMTAFDAAAIDAVRQWRYAPATVNGLPVRVLLTVTVGFTLPR